MQIELDFRLPDTAIRLEFMQPCPDIAGRDSLLETWERDSTAARPSRPTTVVVSCWASDSVGLLLLPSSVDQWRKQGFHVLVVVLHDEPSLPAVVQKLHESEAWSNGVDMVPLYTGHLAIPGSATRRPRQIEFWARIYAAASLINGEALVIMTPIKYFLLWLHPLLYHLECVSPDVVLSFVGIHSQEVGLASSSIFSQPAGLLIAWASTLAKDWLAARTISFGAWLQLLAAQGLPATARYALIEPPNPPGPLWKRLSPLTIVESEADFHTVGDAVTDLTFALTSATPAWYLTWLLPLHQQLNIDNAERDLRTVELLMQHGGVVFQGLQGLRVGLKALVRESADARKVEKGRFFF